MSVFTDFIFAPYIRDADMAGRAPWHVAERRLLDYLLVFVRQGECRFAIDGKILSLQAGTFCLIQPGQRVELRGITRTVTPYAHFDLFYNPRREHSFATRPGQIDLTNYADLMQPALNACDGISLPICFDAPIAQWSDEWLSIVRLWRNGEVLRRQQASQKLGVWLLQLLQHFAESKVAPSTPASGRDFGWIPSYLSTHLSENISVPAMASRAQLSPSRFHKVFHEEFGVAPARYLLEMRVHHAAELLATTDWTLAHVARLCGFANVHHFARNFKRVIGVTPGAHRKESRQKDKTQ